MNDNRSRRGFLWEFGAAVLAETSLAAGSGVPTRPLGATGQRVSIIGIGGWHIGDLPESDAIRLMHTAIDEGVTFFDNAWDYHDGRSEELMGKALAMDGYRARTFLMTKNCGRDYQTSKQNLEDSLRRLKTDHLDLWQFHEIVYDNDPDWIFDRGAMRAALEAREAGKIRFIGFTGHKDPRIHLKMLSKPHAWDTCQMPINALDAHYRSFQREVAPVCLKRKIGVIGMKSLGGGGRQGRFIEKSVLPAADLWRYALSVPVSTLVMGLRTLDQLKEAVALARDFKPLPPAEMTAMAAGVKEVASDGRHERFKSTDAYDGPVHRRQHGFDLAG